MPPKFNMNPLKNPMPAQDPQIRNGNFDEVALGYTAEMAIDEAKRCIGCKNRPCVSGCPVGIDIPEFIGKIAEGDFEAAYQIIAKDSALPAVCGRVCPQETQCEQKCTRGIKAGCEAVAIGLYHTTKAALAQNLIGEEDALRILALIEKYGFETALPIERKQLYKAIEGDKKRKGSSIHLIYPTAIGNVVDKVVEFSDLQSAI